MPTANGIITAPVGVEDVAKCLGVGSYDVGYLCSNGHGKINMWSKYKPVRWVNQIGINMTNPDWWKAQDGTCGIDFTDAKASTYLNIPSMFTEDKKNGWVYNPPTGGVYAYRLLDFENYLHTAVPPIANFNVDPKVVEGGTLYAYYDYNDREEDRTGPSSLLFDDIKGDAASGSTGDISLADYYFGIVVVDSNGAIKGRVLNGTGGEVTYKVSGLILGRTYKAYPCLSQQSLGQDALESGPNVLYTLPNAAPAEFKIVTAAEAAGLAIVLYAYYVYNSSGTATQVKWELTVTNENTTGSIAFAASQLRLRFATNAEGDGMQSGESSTTIAAFSVSAGATATKTGTFNLQYNNYPDMEYYLILYLDGGKYTIREEIDAGDTGDGGHGG